MIKEARSSLHATAFVEVIAAVREGKEVAFATSSPKEAIRLRFLFHRYRRALFQEGKVDAGVLADKVLVQIDGARIRFVSRDDTPVMQSLRAAVASATGAADPSIPAPMEPGLSESEKALRDLGYR